MAERVGFEPTLGINLNTLSKHAPLTLRPIRQQIAMVNFSKVAKSVFLETLRLTLGVRLWIGLCELNI